MEARNRRQPVWEPGGLGRGGGGRPPSRTASRVNSGQAQPRQQENAHPKQQAVTGEKTRPFPKWDEDRQQ